MYQEHGRHSTAIPALIHFFILFNIVNIVVSTVKGPVCLDCQHLENPYACNKIRQCPPRFRCFSTYYFEPQSGGLYWDQGCKSDAFCSALPSRRTQAEPARVSILATIQQNHTSSRNKRLLDSNNDPLRFCLSCCKDDSDYCNLLPCENTLDPSPVPTGMTCLSCTDIPDPANCTTIARCAPNEKCAVWTQTNGLMSMGCKDDKRCQSEGNYVSFGKRDFFANEKGDGVAISFDSSIMEGARKSVSVRSTNYRACCDGDFCNSMYCSLFNKLPPGISTVATTPTTTTTTQSTTTMPSTITSPTTTIPTTTIPTTTTPSTTATLNTTTRPSTTISTTTTPSTTMTPTAITTLITITTTTTTTTTTTQASTVSTSMIGTPAALLQPKSLSTPSGQNATFNCRVKGSIPILVLFSIKDDQNNTSSPPCATSTPNNPDDIICNVDCSQKQPGKYEIQCVAANNIASSSDFAILEVKVPTVPLSVDINPSDTTVLPNTLTTIYCRVNGSPEVHYTWIDSSTGQDITNNSDFRTYITRNNTVVLEIMPYGPNIQSVFVCQAFNALDSIYLPFKVRSLINLTVVMDPQDITLTYGAALPQNVSCDFESWPLANVSWFFETGSSSRVPINESQINTVYLGTNVSSTVSITPDLAKQMALTSVTCEADNGYSTISRSADIELLVAAKILTPPKSSVVRSGNNFSLVCEAEGSPEPQMAWTFTDEFGINKILIGADVQKTGATQSLNIDHIYDSGTFTCYAKNPLATVTVAFDVTVL